MATMLSTDEAYDSDFGLSLLAQPRLVPFFDYHLGEESGFMYILAGSLLLGARPFSVHFASVAVGLLTVAAVYRLARQLFDLRVGLYAAFVMAVLMPHIIISHIVLRNILFPLVGCLAFSFLFQAIRAHRLRDWILTGVLSGLMVYTYYAQAVWLGLVMLIQVIWLIKDRATRRKNLLALGIAALVAAPLVIHLLQNWGYASEHMAGVSTFGPGQIAQNAISWVYAWLYQGSAHLQDNPPFRPYLDIPLALLFYPGVLALALTREKRWLSVFVFGLTLAGIAPSLVTDQAPSFFRAVGAGAGVALIAAAGARFMSERLKPLRYLAPVVPVALLLWSGVNSYRDTNRWFNNRDMYVLNEQHINTASQFMADHLPADRPVFFSPFDADHPNVVFSAAWLAPRPVAGFKSVSCIVIPDRTATYFSLTSYDLDFQKQLSTWADIQPVTGDARAPLPWVVFDATPKRDLLTAWQTGDNFGFGDRISLRLMRPMPGHLAPGSATELWIGARALQPLDVAYRVFVHVYGHPSPYEGGPLWAQTDQPLCPSYTAERWRPGEWAITRLTLSLPNDIAPGRYTIAAGIYDGSTSARLQVTQPAGGGDYVELMEVSIP